MHLTQPLHKALIERPQAEALLCGGRRTLWAGLADRVARLAAVLRALGLQPGDRVGMLGLNSDHYLVYLYAVWWAGGVINPVNIRWSAQEIAYSLDDCDTRLLLVDEHFHTTTAGLQALSRSLATLLHWPTFFLCHVDKEKWSSRKQVRLGRQRKAQPERGASVALLAQAR